MTNHLVRNASELVLIIDNFESGWVQHSAQPIVKEGAQSAYHNYFYRGIIYPSVIQNTVAVYPSTDLAKQIYRSEIPQNVSLEYPEIGDECFLDNAVSQS